MLKIYRVRIKANAENGETQFFRYDIPAWTPKHATEQLFKVHYDTNNYYPEWKVESVYKTKKQVWEYSRIMGVDAVSQISVNKQAQS